jgi:hypothetical protein
MSKWIYALSTDAVVFGCFYLWKVEHIDAARAFLTFILWTFAILILLVAFVVGKEASRRSMAFHAYTHASTALTVGLMVWSGMTACAITFFIGWVLVQPKIKVSKEPA